MRNATLLIAQFGSLAMVIVSALFGVLSLFGGSPSSAFLGLGGVLFWHAMSYVFDATGDYLNERDARLSRIAEAQAPPPRQPADPT